MIPGKKIILVTGSTDGIGFLTALHLAEQGNHVIVHGRNEEKVNRVVRTLKEKAGNKEVDGLTADLSAVAEVRKLADEIKNRYPQIDLLINNAGVGFAAGRYSKDGFELRFAVNYLAPFLLTHLLLPLIEKGDHARIVNVASVGQSPVDLEDLMLENNFNGTEAYRRSKLALVMFTIDLAEKFIGKNITVNCLHPGTYLDTNMVREAKLNPLGKPESGAEAVVFIATSPGLEKVSGKYFNVKSEARPNAQAFDEQVRRRLWEKSLLLTGLSH